jgi:AcrR family transcriptional regulator
MSALHQSAVRAGGAETRIIEAQRARLIAAMTSVVGEIGAERAPVKRIVAVAGMSRHTFYAQFADREDCLLAAFTDGVQRAQTRVSATVDRSQDWTSRIRGGLLAVLEFFDQEPAVARLLVVHSLTVGPDVLAARAKVLEQLAELIDEGRTTAKPQPAPLTAQGAIGGVLSIIHTRLLATTPVRLTELLGPLMSFIVAPYRGPGAARREIARSLPVTSQQTPNSDRTEALQEIPFRLTYRTLRVLSTLAAQDGLSNAEVAARSGITDQGQTSKLLARMARLELVAKQGVGHAKGAANAWQLTARGARLERALRPGAGVPHGHRRVRRKRAPSASGV